MSAEEGKKPGCLGAVLWTVLAVLATLAGGAWLAVAASGSESAGVAATYYVLPPVLGLWAAALVAIVLRFVKIRSGLVRIGAPFGCGCLGAILVAVLTAFFFAAVWPSL